MTDAILIKDLTLLVPIGITAQEQDRPQVLSVDITVNKNLKPAGENDDLSLTTDYRHICDAVQNLHGPFQTLEGFAERAAQAIRQQFLCDRVKLRVKKPGALARRGARYAAVLIER